MLSGLNANVFVTFKVFAGFRVALPSLRPYLQIADHLGFWSRSPWRKFARHGRRAKATGRYSQRLPPGAPAPKAE
jgi:hypothetical protein